MAQPSNRQGKVAVSIPLKRAGNVAQVRATVPVTPARANPWSTRAKSYKRP